MATTDTYPTQLEFDASYRLGRWRPPVQWLLAIPHLAIASALTQLRNVLTVISLFTVLFTKRIPRSIFDAIAMTYRYEWRAISYALFLHEDYPPFDFTVGSDDDRAEPHTTLTIRYPAELNRWKPLYKWLLAIPHYVVLALLFVAACFSFLAGLVAVVVTGEYPHRIRDFLVNVYRYGLRVKTSVGLLTDSYPPFRLHV
jgi:ABC-type uncharacterized transport system YnjBCD permease subunit